MKKLTALLIIACLVTSMLPVQTLAQSSRPADGSTFTVQQELPIKKITQTAISVTTGNMLTDVMLETKIPSHKLKVEQSTINDVVALNNSIIDVPGEQEMITPVTVSENETGQEPTVTVQEPITIDDNDLELETTDNTGQEEQQEPRIEEEGPEEQTEQPEEETTPKEIPEKQKVEKQTMEENEVKKTKPVEELPEALKIINRIEKISEATTEEQEIISEFFKIDFQSLLTLEEKGHSKYASINMATMISDYELSIEEVEEIKNLYPNISKANSVLLLYKKFKTRNKLSANQTKQIKQLILKGYTMPQIEPAFIVGSALKTDIEKLIKKDKEIDKDKKIEELSFRHNNDQIEAIKRVVNKYAIDIDQFLSYIEQENMEFNQVEKVVTEYAALMEIQSIESTTGGTLNYTKYLNSPFNYRENDNETVNLAGGSLRYDKNLITISGRNGMDVNIDVHYDSAQANLYKANYDVDVSYKVCYWDSDGLAYSIDGQYPLLVNEEPNWDYAVRAPVYDVSEISDKYYSPTTSSSDIQAAIDQATYDADAWLDDELDFFWYEGEYTNSYYLFDRWGATPYYFAGDPPPHFVREYLTTLYLYDPLGIKTDIDNLRDDTTYLESNYNIGAGWSFGFPSIEITEASAAANDLIRLDGYLHIGNGEIYKIWAEKVRSGSIQNAGIEEYTLKDMVLDSDGTFSNGQTTSYYVLEYKDGSKKYFDNSGKYIGNKDRYGNTIKIQYNINGYPQKIIDTLNREIIITYQTTATGREVILTTPDNSQIKLELEPIASYANNYVLKKIYDPQNRTTEFNYQIQTGNYDFESKSVTSSSALTNVFANLNTIVYPTSATSHYTYEKAIGNLCSEGLYEYYRIKTRKDQENSTYYNEKTYGYDGNYTGYPNIDDPNNLPIYFTYKTTVIDGNNSETEYIFDNKHLLVQENIKENGITLKRKDAYGYDDNKLITNQTTTIYDTNENGTSGSIVYTEQWLYDANDYGDLIEYTDQLNHKTYYTYDSIFHQLTSERKYLNPTMQMKTEYIINVQTGNVDQIKQQHYENGVNKTIITDCTYDSYGNLLTSATINGDKIYVEENEYGSTYNNAYLTKKTLKLKDAATGNILEQIIPAQNTYDINTGRILTSKDGKTNTTTYQYDDLGRLTRVTNPDTTYIEISYNDQDNIVTLTNENGHQTRNIYDGLGRLKQTQELKNSAWVTIQENSYNAQSQLQWSKDAELNMTQIQYDIFGRLTKTIYPNLQEIEIVYHDAENKKVEIDEEGNTHKYYYDNKGRLLQEKISTEGTETANIYYDYDYIDNLTQTTDANGNETDYTYDDLGRLISVTNALNETTTYKHDNLDNMVEITYPDNSSIQKEYNVLDSIITQTDSLNQTESYTYDAAGNIATYTDKKGIQTIFNYDNRNRLQSKTANGATISYTYDDAGNLKTITDSSGTINYNYYENNQLQTETQPGNKTTQYEYNNNGGRTKITDPFNLSVNYLYDTQNRLDTITVDSKTFDYEYYNDGMLKAVNYPTLNSGLVLREEFTYDNSNRLKTVINKKGSQIISQYSYTYDDQGNILSVTQNGQTNQYQYDELNRLQSSDKANGNYASYQYDHRGNRSQSIGDNTAIEAFIPGSFTYDQWENLTQFTANNADNNYSYRPDGLRNQKTTITGTTKYYLDNNDCVIAEADENNNVAAQNIWGHQALARKVNGAYYYYLYNGHGDVVQMVDEAGNIVNSYEYDEWGNMAGEQEQIPNPIRYAGEYYDAESGLYYLRARYYDPTIGRFIAEDSYEGDVNNPLSLNLYTYCYNNPLVYVDPSGHECGAINIPDKEYHFTWQEWLEAIGTAGMAYIAINGVPEAVIMKSLTSSKSIYSNLAKQATKNPKSSEVVIGKYNQGGISYVKVAQKRGATYFQLKNWDNVVKKVGEDNIWNINKSFIKQQANAGKTFILSHNPAQATGYFAKEINLLKQMGYKFVKQGSVWKAIK